jgi:predicted alpha/beta superfamily hydrolase
LNRPFSPDFRVGQIQSGETIAGDVRLHAAFPSDTLQNQRDIVVYLPPSYRHQRERRYPVLYLQDGQNVFDARTAAFGVEWGFDEAAERMIHDGEIEELIIVGVYNTPARMAEYTPKWSEREDTGRADPYGTFLMSELMPFIQETYRTLPVRTGLLGSSLGGLCSLYLGLRFPDRFTRVGAVSPSLWFGQGTMFAWIESMTRIHGPERLWVCAGSLEGRPPGSDFSYAIQGIRRLRQLLVDRGYAHGRSLFYCEAQGGRHDEASWGRRVPDILRSLYPRHLARE